MIVFIFLSTICVPFVSAANLDGHVEPSEYSMLLAAQNVPTGFGDNISELDAVYANIGTDGSLELAITGNLETNGNTIVIFFDTRAGGAVKDILEGGYGQLGAFGGQKVDDWGTDIDGGSGVYSPPGGGSILDRSFNPDFALEFNLEGSTRYLNVIDMTVPNDPNQINRDIYLGCALLGDPNVTFEYWRDNGTTYSGYVVHAIDNGNSQGVLGYDFGNPPGPLGDPLSATSGIEFLFSPEFLAQQAGRNIKLMIFITNGGGDYLSNQFLPPLGNVPNIGGPGDIGGEPLFDARLFDGNQYITIAPAGCIVNFDDIAVLALYWMENCTMPPYCQGADLNNSSSIDTGDLKIVCDNWLDPCPINWSIEIY